MNECAACFDEVSSEFIKLDCGHFLHNSCLSKLISQFCPFCRAELINIPEKAKEEIIRNGEEFRRETIEEETRELSRQLGINALRSNENIEIVAALMYLNIMGIPRRLIPENITVETYEPSPEFPPGYIMNTTIRSLIDYVQTNYDLEDIEDISEEEMNDLRPIQRNIQNAGEIPDDSEQDIESSRVNNVVNNIDSPVYTPNEEVETDLFEDDEQERIYRITNLRYVQNEPVPRIRVFRVPLNDDIISNFRPE